MNTIEQRIEQLEVAMMFKLYKSNQISVYEWYEYSSTHAAIFQFTFNGQSITMYGLLDELFHLACNTFKAKCKSFTEDDMNYIMLY